MLSPNLASILFSEQWLTVYGLVFDLHVLNLVQSADLAALNNAGSKKLSSFLFSLPDSTRTNPTQCCLNLPDPESDLHFFASRHNTNRVKIELDLEEK